MTNKFNQKIAINVSNVSKDFLISHQKNGSIKSLFTGMSDFGNKKQTEVQHALKDVSFEIEEGEFFGIVGRNGSGKSTLLKILAGIYQPTEGSVSVRGKLVPFIELGVGFNPELTGRENIYLNGALLGFSKNIIDEMYDDIVDFAELEKFMDQKLKNYSSGMQVRLAFSMAIRAKADILLIDEVLAVGDADFQKKCFHYFKKLKRLKKTVVFVSHDMDAIESYCDRAVLINDSKLVCVDKATKVADQYRKLFVESEKNGEGNSVNDNKRWGDRSAKYSKINTFLSDGNKNLVIEAEAKILKNIEQPIFGFTLKNETGVQILGINSRMKKQIFKNLSKGQTVIIKWQIPNIFSDGIYFIDPAIVYDNGLSISDWWEDGSSINIINGHSTPFLVSPEIDLKISIN